jgi:hypothetical protein
LKSYFSGRNLTNLKVENYKENPKIFYFPPICGRVDESFSIGEGIAMGAF